MRITKLVGTGVKDEAICLSSPKYTDSYRDNWEASGASLTLWHQKWNKGTS